MGLVGLTRAGSITDIVPRAVKRIEGPTAEQIEGGEIWTDIHFIDGEILRVAEPPSDVRKLLIAAGVR